MPELVLIRGVPGSGKSTFAARFYPHFRHFEADQWMVDGDGNYSYNPDMLAYCHQRCLDSTRDALAEGHNVVVSNTFTRLWELGKYTELVPVMDQKIIRMTSQYENVHGVPKSVIDRMLRQYEPHPIEISVPTQHHRAMPRR